MIEKLTNHFVKTAHETSPIISLIMYVNGNRYELKTYFIA